MCQPKSRGGQRCAAHTRADMQAAETRYDADASIDNYDALQTARAEYAATPTGRSDLEQRLADAHPTSVNAVDLAAALRRGALIRDRNQAVRAATAPPATPVSTPAVEQAISEQAAPAPTVTPDTDRFGFPTRTCTRCGGSGEYSYNAMTGSRCFGCNGSGRQHKNKQVSEAFGKFAAARREAIRPTAGRLEAGDEVTFDWNDGATKPRADATWRTVASVVPTSETCGSSTVGAGDNAVTTHFYYQKVIYTDGTTERHSENGICCRRGKTVDPAPFLAEATAPRPRRPRAAA